MGAEGAVIGCGTGCRQSPSKTRRLAPVHPHRTSNGLREPQDDTDESAIRPVPDHTNELPTPQDASTLPQPLATPHTAQLPEAAPQPWLMIRLPGRHMSRLDVHPTTVRGQLSNANESIEYVEDDNSSTDRRADTLTQPRQDISYVHGFPARSTRSGLTRDGRVQGVPCSRFGQDM